MDPAVAYVRKYDWGMMRAYSNPFEKEVFFHR
jgi:hypothetical protein